MTNLRKAVLACGLIIGGGVMLLPAQSHAQWWSSSAAPSDFEECAERAKKQPGKDTVAECEAKFAGRRKQGGGYTYYDFMQNRSFDIAGPNPTSEESRKIDEQYTAYLAEQRRAIIATAFQRKQQSPPPQIEIARPTSKPVAEPRPKLSVVRKPKVETCEGRLSCSWQELSTKMQSIKKNLFGS